VVEVQVLALAEPAAGASAAAEFAGTGSWVVVAQLGTSCVEHTSLTGLDGGCSTGLETRDLLWKPMSSCLGYFGESHATVPPFVDEGFDTSV
jgi:hypothetical protein